MVQEFLIIIRTELSENSLFDSASLGRLLQIYLQGQDKTGTNFPVCDCSADHPV